MKKLLLTTGLLLSNAFGSEEASIETRAFKGSKECKELKICIHGETRRTLLERVGKAREILTKNKHINLNEINILLPKEPEMLALLIARGFDINASNRLGERSLHFIIEGGVPKCVRGESRAVIILCLAGADVDAKNDSEHGYTSLHYSIERDNKSILMALIINNANPLLQNNEGNIPLDDCKPSTNIYELLKEYTELHKKNDQTGIHALKEQLKTELASELGFESYELLAAHYKELINEERKKAGVTIGEEVAVYPTAAEDKEATETEKESEDKDGEPVDESESKKLFENLRNDIIKDLAPLHSGKTLPGTKKKELIGNAAIFLDEGISEIAIELRKNKAKVLIEFIQKFSPDYFKLSSEESLEDFNEWSIFSVEDESSFDCLSKGEQNQCLQIAIMSFIHTLSAPSK